MSPSLHIEQRESEGIVILDLEGQLIFGQGDLELRDKLACLHQSGKVNIDFVQRQEGGDLDRHPRSAACLPEVE